MQKPVSRRSRKVSPAAASTKIPPAKNPRKGTIVIQNIVASVAWDSTVDLEKISAAFRDVETKDNFPGLVLRLLNPKTTILLFKSGKMVLTGLKHRKDVMIAVQKVFRRFEGIDIPVPDKPRVIVQNIVASGDLGMRVDLDAASMVLERAIYEPEVFPGLICRTVEPKPKACFLIFSSGKIVCTGMKQEADILEAVRELATSLKNNGLLVDAVLQKEQVKKELMEMLAEN